MIFGIAALLGIALGLFVWGGRDFLYRQYLRNVDWVTRNSLRFQPEPVNGKMLVAVAYGGLIVLLAALVLITPVPIIGVGLWLVLLLLPKLLVEMAWKRRKAKINEQLPGTIAAMANSIRAGLTLVQSIQRLAEQAPEPIRTEFKIMAARYSYGADLESTIQESKERLQLANFNLFASALLMNREMGGDVSTTLSRISQSLDKMRQMRMTVEAHTAEGRTNIKVLLVAPVIMLLFIATVDPEGVKLLFTTSHGYAVLLAAGILTGVGVYFAAQITRTEV